jgi:hypothetical protein
MFSASDKTSFQNKGKFLNKTSYVSKEALLA